MRSEGRVSESGSTPSWLPVVMALGAMAVAVVAILKKPDADTDARNLDIAALELRVSELEDALNRVELARMNPGLEVAPAPPPAPGIDVETRLGELEKRVAKGQKTPKEEPVSLTELLRRRHLGKDDGKTPEQLQQQATDTSLAADKRLQALRRLRGMPGGRSRDVVLSMLELYRESDDATVRADVFRQLSGVKEPELRDACIDALRNDREGRVREEAAETLGPFRGDPAAVDALTYAAENDTSRKVRKEARKALEEEDDER